MRFALGNQQTSAPQPTENSNNNNSNNSNNSNNNSNNSNNSNNNNNNNSNQPSATPTATAVVTAQTGQPVGSMPQQQQPGQGGPVNTAMSPSNGTRANATQSAPVNNANPFAGKPTYASFSNDIPPAYLTWKKPIPNQTFPPLYKIGVSNISFEWTVDPNVLKVQPANLTVALANPQKQTYTAAIVAGTATSAYWDLAHLPPGSPLMVGYYTVWVYDQRGPKAFPSPGWLMPDSRLVVAMYSTEAYVGRTDCKKDNFIFIYIIF